MKSYKPVKNFQIEYTKLFINNEWVDSISGNSFTTINPSTEEVIARVQEGDERDIDKAVQAARVAFKRGSKYRQMDASQRGFLLHKLADLYERDIEKLATLLALDTGKPFNIAIYSVEECIKILRYYGGAADKIQGQTIPVNGNVMAYTIYEPVGVVGAITPWNVPLIIDTYKLGPAIAAGCTIVYKPSELTPLISLQNAALMREAGFPPGVVNIVNGQGQTAGAALSMHPNIDKISFTGSPRVGRLIQKASGDSNLKKVTLELGGKAPFIVCKNANLDIATSLALRACFFNSGQVCCALTRTFVHESVFDEFIRRLKLQINEYTIGSQFESDVKVGPLISEFQMKKVLGYIAKGVKEGAKLEIGGKKHRNVGYFIEPTVFSNVTDEMTIAKEEIFGPVQSIFEYSSLEEVIDRANDTQYGLSAAICTDNLDEAITLSSQLLAGQVYINGFLNGSPQLPFGGYKMSGIGRELGMDGLMAYTETKAVTVVTSSKIM